jgi:hypothetical protein
MRWEQAIDQGPLMPGPIAEWGKFSRYTEIGDDDYAVRQVDEFESGKLLRYDRSHWTDKFGMLADATLPKVPRKKSPWKVVTITANEFEQIWARAENSPEWKIQQSESLMKDRGNTPPWLMPR